MGREDRLHAGGTGDQRDPFQRDRDRLLYSEALRRLQGVTQVVSADEGIVVHNRLTHSLKVAQVARRIAENIQSMHSPDELAAAGGLSADVAEAAALAHDLGHPPFGHVAEEELQRLAGQSHFEGNAQSFRILTKLEPHRADYRGLDLTRATLAATLKYPRARHSSMNCTVSKYGYYHDSEAAEFAFARAGAFGETKTLEAEIMDFADDVTFAVHDTEDFYRAGLIPLHLLKNETTHEWRHLVKTIRRRWEHKNDDMLREWDEHESALGDLLFMFATSDTAYRGEHAQSVAMKSAASGIIANFVQNGIRLNPSRAPGESTVQIDADVGKQLKMLKELVWVYVIDRPSLAYQQEGHRRVVRELYKCFLAGIVRGDERAYLPGFSELIKKRDPKMDSDERLAADMVCALTDRQALGLYRKLLGVDPGTVTSNHF